MAKKKAHTKKVDTKAVAVKAEEITKEVIEEATVKAEEIKEAANTAVKKTAAKAKKTVAKKEMKVNAVVEYKEKKIEEKTIIADVKKAWTKAGNKVGDIKTMDLYIKPEDDAVYYVINGTEKGSVAF